MGASRLELDTDAHEELVDCVQIIDVTPRESG